MNLNGLTVNINYKNSKSLGLKLIQKLVLQLKGDIVKDTSKKGTNYIISFQGKFPKKFNF